MKVKVEREVDIDWLLNQLDNKSQVHPNGMAGYEVRVDKQLLRDAHDVIIQLREELFEAREELFERAIEEFKRCIKTK